MAQAQLIQGTWEQISTQAEELRKRKHLILIIPGEEDVAPENATTLPYSVQIEPESVKAARLLAIEAGMGKFKYSGVASEELLKERQADKLREDSEK